MPAAEVKRIMGAPAEIKSMPSPTGKAEVWIYRRTVDGPPEQILVGGGTTTVPYTDSNGSVHQQIITEPPQYRVAYRRIDETTEVLMFDDAYIEQKRTAAVRRDFN